MIDRREDTNAVVQLQVHCLWWQHHFHDIREWHSAMNICHHNTEEWYNWFNDFIIIDALIPSFIDTIDHLAVTK